MSKSQKACECKKGLAKPNSTNERMVKTKLECATSRRALGDMKNVPVTRATKQSTGRIVRNEGGNPKVVKITDKQKAKTQTAQPSTDFGSILEACADDNDEVIEKFNYHYRLETFEERFPEPEQRFDVTDVYHKVVSNNFVSDLLSEILYDDELEELNKRNPQTNEECEAALHEIFGDVKFSET